MNPLTSGDWLARGQQYTFSFKFQSIPGFTPTSEDVRAILESALGTIVSIQNVTITGGLWGFGGDQINVTFFYLGESGTDQVQNMADAMIGFLSGISSSASIAFSMNFVSAVTGDTPTDTGVGSGPGIPHAPGFTSSLILIVIGLGLIVFLASGGAGVARRVAA